MAAKNAITVGVDVFKGIVVQARGKPAQVVAYAAAGAVAAIGAAVGYGAYQGFRYLAGKRPPSTPAD